MRIPATGGSHRVLLLVPRPCQPAAAAPATSASFIPRRRVPLARIRPCRRTPAIMLCNTTMQRAPICGPAPSRVVRLGSRAVQALLRTAWSRTRNHNNRCHPPCVLQPTPARRQRAVAAAARKQKRPQQQQQQQGKGFGAPAPSPQPPVETSAPQSPGMATATSSSKAAPAAAPPAAAATSQLPPQAAPAAAPAALPTVGRGRIFAVCAQVSVLVTALAFGLRQVAPLVSPAVRDGQAAAVEALLDCECPAATHPPLLALAGAPAVLGTSTPAASSRPTSAAAAQACWQRVLAAQPLLMPPLGPARPLGLSVQGRRCRAPRSWAWRPARRRR